MHRYWLHVCTNLSLSIYWIRKKWCYICSCIPPIVKLFTRKDTALQRAQQPIACLMSCSTTKCVSHVSGSTTRATTLTRSASPPTTSWTPSRAYATPLPAHVHTTYLSKEMAKIIWWRTLGEECFENHYDGWWTHASVQSPYWSWRPVPLGEPLVSATGYWRTTNQGVWILENQTPLMCIGMDDLSIGVNVYNGTPHSPWSHLLWNTIVHYEGSQIDARNIGTTYCSWRHQVMDCVFIVASLVTYRVPVNLFATQPISMWSKKK